MAREQRLVFGEVADLYDRIRPGYPPSLVDEVVSSAGLAAGDTVLEVGCGTGKATVPFAARALTVTALEPDPDMASIAQRNCASLNATVEVSSFEDWVAPSGAGFALVMAAQSWHWVQPGLRLSKAREVLAVDGALALFWNRPDWPSSPLGAAIDAVYERVVPELGARTPGRSPQDVGRRVCVDELVQSDLFGRVSATEHAWDTAYDRDTYLQLLDTQSDHRLLGQALREQLFREIGRAIDDAGGTLPVSYVAELYLARRRVMDEPEARQRVASAPIARLATVRANGEPHVVPVCFAVDGDRIVSVVDHKPKVTTSLRRFDNVRAHPAVSLLVDHYDDDWARLWWVRVDGTAVVRDAGTEHRSAIDLLAAKYRQYRELRPAGSVLEITASRWLGWSAA